MKSTKHGNDTKSFEDAFAAEPKAAQYCLRLFVAGNSPQSTRAIQNIQALCEETLAGQYDLAVIDIYQHPEQAKPEQIIVTPTLLKKLPFPVSRVVGDLSDKERLLAGLAIAPRDAAAATPGRKRRK